MHVGDSQGGGRQGRGGMEVDRQGGKDGRTRVGWGEGGRQWAGRQGSKR